MLLFPCLLVTSKLDYVLCGVGTIAELPSQTSILALRENACPLVRGESAGSQAKPTKNQFQRVVWSIGEDSLTLSA